MDKMFHEFSLLPREKKEEKIRIMLDDLKAADESFMRLYERIIHEQVPEDTLIILYHDIVMFAHALSEFQESRSTEAMNEIDRYLEGIRKLEADERLKDQQDIEEIEKSFT